MNVAVAIPAHPSAKSSIAAKTNAALGLLIPCLVTGGILTIHTWLPAAVQLGARIGEAAAR